MSLLCGLVSGQDPGPSTKQASYAELKAEGARRSSYRDAAPRGDGGEVPVADLASFRRSIEPVLAKACYSCHGPRKQKGDVRIDTLDPDLFGGDDVDWWLDVLSVLTNGEMPPADDEHVELADADRQKVIEWLASESQLASTVRRATSEHSSFRRMTRYEYGYALQDLLGLPFAFGEDLPPDPISEDGFENSSEVLHLTGIQFRAYRDAARKALKLATVAGARPEPRFWRVSMESAAAAEWAKQEQQLAKVRNKHKDDPAKRDAELQRLEERFSKRPRGAHYVHATNGRRARQSWGYNGAKFAWRPVRELPEVSPPSGHVARIPKGSGLIVELGNQLPERGVLRVRVRAARVGKGANPAMQLLFGWQASNDSSASFRVEAKEHLVDAKPGAPRFYEWRVPLSQVYPRNLMRTVSKMGQTPSPSEYVKIVNGSLSGASLEVDVVEVTAPFTESWPPLSHRRLLPERAEDGDEATYARAVLRGFMASAWRRTPRAAEVDRKVRLFERIRPNCETLAEAMVEVLAAVLSSPHFVYVVEASPSGPEDVAGSVSAEQPKRLSGIELATRLSMFLWCSLPDAELLELGRDDQLREPEVLARQVARLLASPRSERFSRQFVRQWLNLDLLDYLHVDRKVHRGFGDALQAAMRAEPVHFFAELLAKDLSALEFLHADFAMVDERLARHYGLQGVVGNQFRRVELGEQQRRERRGGLLTMAGLLAMNSDGLDSHPLKRGIWMLERLLNDPPPPPPAAVPEIDLADPEIAKMTLKERIENHRNDPACMSCHAKIDPWGIAFEEFDAVGRFRTSINGRPVDSSSVLFNKQRLDGVDGLKRFLIRNRQDQFLRALAHKLTTFALGRPLTFGDRAAIDGIVAESRKRGDGLATMVSVIATSDLFRTK